MKYLLILGSVIALPSFAAGGGDQSIALTITVGPRRQGLPCGAVPVFTPADTAAAAGTQRSSDSSWRRTFFSSTYS